jgi:hypothetical protein
MRNAVNQGPGIRLSYRGTTVYRRILDSNVAIPPHDNDSSIRSQQKRLLMRHKAYMRVFNGQLAIFVGFPDAEHVLVSINGCACCLARAHWHSLRICR